jgi:hypothetical protein
MDAKQAKGHVSLVAGLHIGYGVLKIFGSIFMLLAMRFAWGFIPDEEEIVRDMLRMLFSILPSILAFFGIIDVLAGIALFSYKSWSRVLMIIISALNCLNIPIGTAIGVYSLWALMKPEVLALFEEG